MTSTRTTKPSGSDGTPQATLDQMPHTIKIITALVIEPERGLGKAMWNAGRILATADTQTQWHLVDAALTIAETLRDTLTGLMGAPFMLRVDPGFYAELPDAARAGAQAAFVLVQTDDQSRRVAKFRDPLLDGKMAGEAVVGAYLMACVLAHQCVLVLAQGSGMTPAEAWKKARPLLMP